VERLTALLFRSALAALSHMSLHGQRRLGRWLGRLTWHRGGDAARTTRINLATCFPDLDAASRRRLARESLEHTGMLAAELGAVYRWPERRWRRLTVAVEGDRLIDAALERRQGVLILVPHFGNWEFLALALGRYRVTALYDPPRIAALEPLVRQARDRAGANLLPIDAGGLRGFYKALVRGQVAALLPDQVPDRNAGVYVDFFGAPALTMTFVHRLLQRTDPVVLLGTAVRREAGFEVRYIDLGRALHDPDPLVSARAMNRAIEDLITTDPAQYQWEYKRFKRQPRGRADPYRAR
jgi:Kdo2-lipid IVA lauroyltransferase/acyltransferase